MAEQGRITVGKARRIAVEWVRAHAADLPGLIGAYTVGSINELDDAETVPKTSDLDVMVVLNRAKAPPKAGKMNERGVLLEITYLAWDDVRNPDRVLGHYHLATGMATAQIMIDTSGRLKEVIATVRKEYGEPAWIRRRCQMAERVVLDRLDAVNVHAPAHQRAMPWLFATGGLPHILLVAGMRNPTVRRRYEAVSGLLEEYARVDVYAQLLDLAGVRDLTAEQVTGHLEVLKTVFDTATRVCRSPFFFASDISPEARPLAIDGSCEMILRGQHREAMFWIAVTFTRCMYILHANAPDAAAQWEDAFHGMLDDLGVLEPCAMARSVERIRKGLPEISALAATVVRKAATSPEKA